jgi:predicted RNase H-like nuclease (RuvC/YqgF family)
VEIQLAAKDQQIADQKSEFARLEELIAAETAARQKDIEQLKKDHSGEIEQRKKEIEQLKKKITQFKKDHSGEIEQRKKEIEQLKKKITQLKKDHKKDRDDQGERVQLLEMEVRKHKEAIAAMGARKATFDKSKGAFDRNFDKIVNAVGKSASTSQVRKRSSTRAMAEQEVTPQPVLLW